MKAQTNQSPADDRFAGQQADDRGDVVSWGEHVSDDEARAGAAAQGR